MRAGRGSIPRAGPGGGGMHHRMHGWLNIRRSTLALGFALIVAILSMSRGAGAQPDGASPAGSGDVPATPATARDGGSPPAANVPEEVDRPDAAPRAVPGTASASGSARTPALPMVTAGPGPEVRRDTPRDTVSGFLDATAAEDFDRAALYLDLHSVPFWARKERGPELARLFAEVIERTVWLDVEAVPDDPEGLTDETTAPPKDLRIATVPMARGSQGIRLERVRDAATGGQVWLFSKATVQSIERMHAVHGPPEVVQSLPAWTRRRTGGMQVWQWGGIVVVLLFAWMAGHLVERPTIWAIKRATSKREIQGLIRLATIARGPVHRMVGLVLARIGLELLGLSASAHFIVMRFVEIGLILVGMQAAIRLVAFAAQTVIEESSQDDDDLMRAKTIATRVTAIRRIAIVLVVLVGMAVALMQFPSARSAGWSLLGSAGLAGAIIGFAAQKTMANLFAGILIAITQPMRIGDTVIVENEWGVVEEIGLTHVVVRIWDLRRLVLPVTWFLDQPFQNWTRTSTELVGTVFVHADFGVDVEAVRAELRRALEGQALWNGKTAEVIVSELSGETVVLRATVSADDASKLWDLRCLVRERMLTFLQADESRLPRRRVTPATPPLGA